MFQSGGSAETLPNCNVLFQAPFAATMSTIPETFQALIAQVRGSCNNCSSDRERSIAANNWLTKGVTVELIHTQFVVCVPHAEPVSFRLSLASLVYMKKNGMLPLENLNRTTNP